MLKYEKMLEKINSRKKSKNLIKPKERVLFAILIDEIVDSILDLEEREEIFN